MPDFSALPLVIAGPIVRRVEPTLASVWVALSKPRTVTLSIWIGDTAVPAAGTFYAWCDVSGAINRLRLANDDAFAEHLLEKGGVAGVPGTGFGGPGHIRFSFASGRELLGQALERIAEALG